MQYANEALFLVFSLVLAGLFVSSLPYFRGRISSKLNTYWLIALGLNIATFLFFASASTVHPILLTFANTFFLGAYFFLAIFCRALSDKPVKWLVMLSPFILLVFGLAFEYLRWFGTFQGRVLLVILSLMACIVLVLVELISIKWRSARVQVNFLIFTFSAELVLGVLRLWMILFNTSTSVSTLYSEPLISTLVRWFAVGFTVLSYISINGIMAERLIKESDDSREDSIRVSKLLAERDALIANLLKNNKSAAAGALSASIAHELNQPLGASLLNIQFLKMVHESGRLTPELLEQLINQLEKDAKRSGNIIRSLQSVFAKSSADFEEFSVEEVIESALAIYKLDLMDRGITFEKSLNIPIKIYGHKGQFLQVLLNLINNSIQALSHINAENKTLGINASLQGNFGVVEVFDNGPGISKDHQAHLFNLLVSDKEKGMGLGLWLCSQILDNFHGKISYEDAPGGGAKFILSLPITPPSGLDSLRA
ncbi:sensor histidine kinase [Polynucleobacter sp. MWH-Jannik1A5]|uniref:sensor histidine kinase n=1 Tax=Polynucleobacter sp. MWH-Jannik1A5 TaxID=1855890 RepID=UPI001C0B6B26|nr:HAMP domain-containing sensor histidine kinase [Polynucleobacter sp. MWH-Jannik1A5]